MGVPLLSGETQERLIELRENPLSKEQKRELHRNRSIAFQIRHKKRTLENLEAWDEETEKAIDDALNILRARQRDIYATERTTTVEEISDLLPDYLIDQINLNANQFQ
jgi:hypothetical protein